MITQIQPGKNNFWQLRATISKTAKRSQDERLFIEPFDVGKTFESEFIAVGVKVNSSKDNWRNAGYLTQEYKFSSSGYSYSGKAFFRTEELSINNVQILRLPLLSDSTYKLRYFPPTYFLDVRLQLWEYQGLTVNTLIGDLAQFLAEVEPSQLINLSPIEQKLDQLLLNQQSNLAVDLSVLEAKLNQILELISDNSPEEPQEPSQAQQQFYFFQ